MESTPISTVDVDLQPSNLEWGRLLNRIIESTPFRRSARLRDFLIYVGNEVVLHGATDLHEQQIGIAVFDRSASYDTSQDNIVRVNAMELRKRLEIYFANEGAGEPLVLEIPRGSYGPVFRRRQEVSPPVDVPAEVPPAADSPAAVASLIPETPPKATEARHLSAVLRHPFVVALLILAVVLTAGLIIAVRRAQQSEVNLHSWQNGPALRSFWGNFFGRKLPPEIVLADTSFVLAQDVLHRRLTLAEYLDYSYRTAKSSEPSTEVESQQQRKDLNVIFDRSSGSIGDFRVARKITELQTGEDGTRLVFAREYAGHRLRWNNTIFVGSSRSNPWVELFEDRLAYHFNQPYDSSPSFVVVEKPVNGEQAQYPISSKPGTRTAYCMLVFLPNPTNTGNTLIVAGTDSQATEAGGDFLTSEESLEKLQSIFHVTRFPYFQVLLKISRSNGTPLESEVLSYRLASK